MAVFSYITVDTTGRQTTGVLSAESAHAGRATLRRGGARILDFGPVRQQKLVARLPWERIGTRRREGVAEWARHLAMLLRTGVPLAEAMDVLIAQSGRRGQAVLRDVREQVSGGLAFSEALGRHPAWFDALFVSAVRVGQATGALDKALGQLAEFLRERQALRAKLTSALIYPLILMVVGVGVVLFLMTYVMPQLLGVLDASGKTLPASTRFLRSISDGLIAHWWLLAVGGPLLVGGLGSAARMDRGRLLWHRAQLRLPLAGTLIAKATVAQFAQTSVMLLKAGVPFVEAMMVVSQCLQNRVLRQELQTIRSAVEAGSDIAPALSGSRVFPPLVVHLFAMGQHTGELAPILEQLKEGYEDEVRLAMGRFTAALEPLLIIVLSGVVGFIIFATMMPILEATRVMG